jgi:hypothetical protein
MPISPITNFYRGKSLYRASYPDFRNATIVIRSLAAGTFKPVLPDLAGWLQGRMTGSAVTTQSFAFKEKHVD